MRLRSETERAVGTAHTEGGPRLQRSFLLADFAASSLTVAFWVDKTYHHGVRPWVVGLEYACAAFFVADTARRCAKAGFARLSVASSPECLLNLLCAAPLLLQGSPRGFHAWLSLSYVRSLRLLAAFDALLSAGVQLVVFTSELRRSVGLAVARFFVLVQCLACSMCGERTPPRGWGGRGA